MDMSQPGPTDPRPLRGVADYFSFAPPGRGGLSRVLRLVRLPRPDDGVRVGRDVLDVRFGPWRVTTPLANIAAVAVAGPYAVWKVLGARLSLGDRGLTFGTVSTRGVCLQFRKPVPGIEPTGLLRHPNLTVTVAQPEMLVARLRREIDTP